MLGGRFKDAVIAGPWVEYEDEGKVYFAQPDFVIPASDMTLIVEVKLSAKFKAEVQLRRLYFPLVQKLWPHENIRMIQVCNFLSPRFADVETFTELDALLAKEEPWDYAVLHYKP